jgi:Zn ribbon nucleic-acid-binding protein
MRCPACGDDLKIYFTISGSVTGIECVPCRRKWGNERVNRISMDLREHMIHQLQMIVKYMDFDSGCVEVEEKPDV